MEVRRCWALLVEGFDILMAEAQAEQRGLRRGAVDMVEGVGREEEKREWTRNGRNTFEL